MGEPVTEREGGAWSAHDPDVPGVYGLGTTRETALADLAEAKALLVDYDARKAAEDAEDARLADASLDEVLAGGAVYTHEEVLALLGLDDGSEAEEDLSVVEQRLADIAEGRVKPILLEEFMRQRGLSSTEQETDARIGIVSDVHGDVFALDAALARLREMDCYPILCAGDLLDVEPFGEEVVQLLKAEGVVTIRGNHERWALERRRRRPDPRKSFQACELSDLAGGGAELSREALDWLASLPSHWTTEIAGVRVAMWHARPGSDMEGIEAGKTGPALRRRLLDQAAADVLIVGHTHDAFESAEGEGKIVNPGACCSKIQAVSGGYRSATFGVIELPSKRFRVFQAADGVHSS